MNIIKTALGGIALSLAVVTSALAAGNDVNATPTGLALQGYDPVAYFTDGAPVKGDWDISAEYNGATYRFATEAHKTTFETNPEAYAPAYGGYCAFGTAMGFKFDGDPTLWKIVDDTLYLNLSPAVQERWSEDIPGFIVNADTNWETIIDASPEELLAQ